MEKVLSIDFDGVIASSDSAKLDFANNVLGLDLQENQMKERFFCETFGKDKGKKLYTSIIASIYSSERMLDVAPVEGVITTIEALQKKNWKCVVVSARSGNIDDEENSQAKWAWQFIEKKRIPIEKSNFYCIGNTSKLNICKTVSALALVDDDYVKLQPVASFGITSFLFTTATNKADESIYKPFQAIRVWNWADLLDKLEVKFS